MIFNTKSLENEIRDPIHKKNDFGNGFVQFLIDLGVLLGGPWGAFFVKKGCHFLSFLVFLCFLVSRGSSGRIFFVF